jgi:hypothetical protein
MLIGLKVKMPVSITGICFKDELYEILYLCECGTRVLLTNGYFFKINTLVFVDKQIEDPMLFSKCIKKHGSLFNALKKSIK